MERPAKVYLRPHDIAIGRQQNGEPSLQARTLRINSAGSVARVTLATSEGQDVLVELPLLVCLSDSCFPPCNRRAKQPGEYNALTV